MSMQPAQPCWLNFLAQDPGQAPRSPFRARRVAHGPAGFHTGGAIADRPQAGIRRNL